MIRDLKRLCLPLVALVAVGVLFASPASADDLTSEVSPVTLTGRGVTADILTFPGVGTTSCAHTTFTATAVTPTTTITMTPVLTECVTLGFPSEVDVNGCDYLMHISGGGSTTATVDIVCPAGQKIDITVNPASPKCTITIGPQTGKGTVTIKNIGAGTTRELELEFNLTKLAANSTEGTGIGKCPTKATTEATQTGRKIVTGEKDEPGNPPHVGIFLS